tara:strand:- start:334 stop:1227 length:894 start_codon:yes stop_codon:yes gene_type:complete
VAKTTSEKMQIELTHDDREQISWATAYTLEQCGSSPVEVETKLDIHVDGKFFTFGYVDMYCGSKRKMFDLKTGNRYDDRVQMMGYALGIMQRDDVMEVEVHIMYSKSQTVDRFVVTRSECEDVARQVRGAVTNPTKAPIPCDYCGWCEHQLYCTAVSGAALTVIDQQDVLAQARDPREITNPLLAARLRAYVPSIEAWVKALKDKCEEFDELPGFKRVVRQATPKIKDVRAVYLKMAGHNIDTYGMLDACDVKFSNLVQLYSEANKCSKSEAEQSLTELLGDLLEVGGTSQYWRKTK